MTGLQVIHRDVEEIPNTYCLFCGWPIILAEDPNRQDFCEHVLFMALDEGGVAYLGARAREELTTQGWTVTAGTDWALKPPNSDSSESEVDDDFDDDEPSVSEVVQALAAALNPPEGLLLIDDPAFFGDSALYLGLGRWTGASD